MLPPPNSRRPAAFTLVELLTVIAIIAVLMGILFPTIGGAIESAKKVQAKNDELAIVTAVKAYYTEYGRYPIDTTITTDYAFGGGATGKQEDLMNVLRYPYKKGETPGKPLIDELNPRKISFLEVKNAKDFGKAGKEREGIGSSGTPGKWLDPWGNDYLILIDGDYDNSLPNPGYTTSGSNDPDITGGVVAWTYGRDGVQGKKGSGNKDFKNSDDVLSWK